METCYSVEALDRLIREATERLYLPERDALIERKVNELADKLLLSQQADELRTLSDYPDIHQFEI